MTGSTQGTNGRSEPRPERGRFSSRRKAEAVLRLLHGEEARRPLARARGDRGDAGAVA